MAKEYIEREVALMGVMRAGCMANTVQVLKDIPAADVVEVKHAQWIGVQNGCGCCSNCHRQDWIDPIATHCRYCGANMDGGAENA